jgi:hypothetical protein
MIDLGDGMTVNVRWRKSTGQTVIQALRKTLKIIQQREQAEQAA